MKIKLSILFISALVLASGCARKCPPCPMNTGSYGAAPSYDAAPVQASNASYSAPAADTSSQYSANSNARYVSK